MLLFKLFNWIIALLGLWEFGDIAAVFVPDFGRIQAFLWSHIVTGLILLVAGLWAALKSNVGAAKKLNWITVVAGGWLVIGPLVLGPPEIAAGLWNDIIVGGIVIILSAWALWLRRRG
jgi:hypothetical protein